MNALHPQPYYICFTDERKVQVCKDVRVSKWQNVHFGKKCSLKAEGSVFYMMEVSAVRMESVLSMLLPESQSCDSEAIWRKSPGAKLWSRCVRENIRLKLTVTNAAVQRFALLLDCSRTLFHSVHPDCSSLKGIVHQKENCVSLLILLFFQTHWLSFFCGWEILKNALKKQCEQWNTASRWQKHHEHTIKQDRLTTQYITPIIITPKSHMHISKCRTSRSIALDLMASEHLAYNIWTISVVFLRQFNEFNCPWVPCAIWNWIENNLNSRILIEVAIDVPEMNLN